MNKENLSQSDLYIGREQTWVKHQILRKYLQRFAYIIGSKWDAITYVDCFSGPWKVESDDFRDSSFSIALEELRKARTELATRNRKPKLRCLFLEKKKSSYQKLKQYAESEKGDDEIVTLNSAVEDSIPEILNFAKKGGFPFIFIDPTGWTGFAMDEIAPLLQLDPGEALINFMTSHITRFINAPDEMTQESFVKLFGSASFKEKLRGLEKRDREDMAVTEYVSQVASTGKFRFMAQAIVLHPENDRTHFHLIYATRHPKGIEVFKEAEKKAMSEMQRVRAGAQQRKQEERTGQLMFSEVSDFHSTSYFDSLRKRYLDKAKENIKHLLQHNIRIAYDEAWALTLKEPLVWESDLKDWVKNWKNSGILSVEGLGERQRVPRYGENHILVWKGA